MNPHTEICENCSQVGLEYFINNKQTRHQLLRCSKCNLYQKGKLPSLELYEDDYHGEYAERLKQKIVTAKIRLGSLKPDLEINSPKVLDIGCSIGATLRAAEQLGWKATGVDVSKSAINLCRNDGLDCHKVEGVALPFASETFDLITHWHVIEHVENVSEALREWRRVLKPGGLMVLETPNSSFLKARLLGPRYEKFWPAEHLYTFNRKNLSSILKQSGFEIINSRLTGGWNALPLHLNAYALCYRSYRQLCRQFGLCKSIEISCRK
jgi:2-polyprenyl-3-methyl-5-hydroxy-6-metoxy-1,4-benzoquinol methylase